MHFPGLRVEAAHVLMEDHDVMGLAVDTLSFDRGISEGFTAEPSDDGTAADGFPVHFAWLPSGRWAVEGIAGLDHVPAVGATIVTRGPTVVGSSGGPSRILALI